MVSAPCRLHLTNGWTVSISESDTPPALCSVAAWPTALDGARLQADQWFKFDDRGLLDVRCWVLGDVRQALAQVSRARPPVLG